MMDTIVDFHSHILPGIDDGSSGLAESMAMLRMEAAQGIGHVVATPHFYPRHTAAELFLERRYRAEMLLREEMARESGLPRLSVGAEVYFFRGMSQSEFLPRLTIGGNSCILIEMPMAPWPGDFYRELAEIWDRWGITPVIAHIDRYIAPLRTHGIPRRLEELPVLVQANADFFLDRATSGMAMRMLKAGQIHLLGSDCHNLTTRLPNLGPAWEKIGHKLGSDVQKEITRYAHQLLGAQHPANTKDGSIL